MELIRLDYDYVKNSHGALIKKCCASCIHHEPENEFRRKCNAGEGSVKPTSCCADWHMMPKLDNAGLGDGRIKRREYLKYVYNYIQPPPPAKQTSIREIRQEFEAEHGSIYLNF